MSRPDPNQTSEPLSPDSVTPPELAFAWIQQGFQQINDRIDRVENRVEKRFDLQDNRLQRIESTVWVAIGCVIIMTGIVGYAAFLALNIAQHAALRLQGTVRFQETG